MNLLSVNAYAKVNLSIDILGKRPEDGYHIVDMLMQTICIFDRIIIYTPDAISSLREDVVNEIMAARSRQIERIKYLESRGISVNGPDPGENIILTCTNPKLPVDQKNLAYKAAQIMKKEAGYDGKLGIHIRKRLPVGGGLGGGSTDGAAVLKGLNRLLELNYSDEKLIEIASKMGSDVPFLVMGGAARATGTGTTLTPIQPLRKGYLVIINPNLFVSTELVYNKFDQLRLSPESHPDNDFLVNCIENGDLRTFCENMKNVLERPAFELEPQIMMLKKKVKATNPLGVLMSGSGSTIFAIYETKDEAFNALNDFRAQGLFAMEADLTDNLNFTGDTL